MNLQPAADRVSRAPLLALVALESLPCGCVSGVYETVPTWVEVELVEAKGPHCVFAQHRPGGVVRLGLLGETVNTGEESTR
jgi:hypothetical protein